MEGFSRISPHQRRKENFYNTFQPQFLQNTRMPHSMPNLQIHQQSNHNSFTNSPSSNSIGLKTSQAYTDISTSTCSGQVTSYHHSTKKQIQANRPLVFQANSKSPTRCYAGAKFGDAPSPRVLPRPPAHWISQPRQDPYNHIATHLKAILQVA